MGKIIMNAIISCTLTRTRIAGVGRSGKDDVLLHIRNKT